MSIFASSLASALSDVCFASVAFCKIPLSPDNIEIEIPANIKRTMIVITRAIKVIPLILFISFFLKIFINKNFLSLVHLNTPYLF